MGEGGAVDAPAQPVGAGERQDADMGEQMSRNGFADCEREYNRREEAIEMAREERMEAMSDTPRTDEVWGSMHGSGYQMMLLAQKLERELAEARRHNKAMTKISQDCLDAKEQAEQERDKHFAASKAQNEDITLLQAELAEARQEKEEAREIHNSNMNRYALRAEQAESRAAALEEALSQMLDDMGVDGLCVCPAAKEQAIAAMGEET